MAKPSKFAHIVYRTRRFEEMIRWYEKVFEAKVQHKNPALAFLTYDDEHHRFAFGNLAVLDPAGKSSAAKADAGVDHVAYTYSSLGDLIDTYTRLKREGIRAEDANAYMQGGDFASNPIGVNFDPDELVEQFKRGVPAQQLLARPAGPPAQIPREHGIGV